MITVTVPSELTLLATLFTRIRTCTSIVIHKEGLT
jgi:hypothetical protein